MNYFLQSVPMLSVNDDQVTLAKWCRMNGEYVKARTVICEVETTKAVTEVEAEAEGFLFHMVEEGNQVAVGKPIAVLAEQNDPAVLGQIDTEKKDTDTLNIVSTPKWTKKAIILARKSNINIEDVPGNEIIQEADVLKYLQGHSSSTAVIGDLIEDTYNNTFRERIIVIGAGFGAAHIIDAIERSERQYLVGIVDDNVDLHDKSIGGHKVLGPLSLLDKLWEDRRFDSLVISFGDIQRRGMVFTELTAKGIRFANILDKTVQVHSHVSIGTGNIILANSRLSSCTVLGDNNFLSAYVNIDHHNVIGSNCTFGPGVMTSGRVTIGNNIKFGTGIFVEPGLSIGNSSIVASGIVITRDIPEYSIVKKLIDYKVQNIQQNIN